ncbi:hypothetical protein Val02_31120 [Virgisporangium aliadipatigenens]|uniref:Adhesin domain-containing protein n=1 Tax=Virgisporangium aliadipatigenens TaxID=741659 RepID=A0A8J4DQP6_9ACTN|nr:hypothetical protein [Virgisporangium aliadipatigenens]GIJ46226.1 hypothetical protein Val02_31120 [Virgisporangium aliadipatigenens]
MRWRVGGSLFTVLVLLIGAVTAATAMTGQDSSGTTRHPGVRRVIVHNPAGPVTVRGGGAEVVAHHRLAWALTKPWLDERLDGSVLTLNAECAPPRGFHISVKCEVAYDIEVPTDIDLEATASGTVAVTGVRGQVAVQSG